MSQTMQLQNGSLVAEIDARGAWLLRLHDGQRPILFPKQVFRLPDGSEKTRGGCHVCLPNFGPGGDSGQPQHGYGREATWGVQDQRTDRLTLRLEHGPGSFSGLDSRLHYRLMSDRLSIELDLVNNGQHPLPVSPGFHPYFTSGEAAKILIDAIPYDVNQLSKLQYVAQPPHRLSIGEYMYALSAENLPVWVVWSDRLGDYVCLEPTEAGESFLEGTANLLQPGQSSHFSFSLGAASGI